MPVSIFRSRFGRFCSCSWCGAPLCLIFRADHSLRGLPNPEGILDNSPTFQRWVSELEAHKSRRGRLKPREPSAVPSGLIDVPGPFPNVETLGYYRMSLRDNGFARHRIHLLGANPNEA